MDKGKISVMAPEEIQPRIKRRRAEDVFSALVAVLEWTPLRFSACYWLSGFRAWQAAVPATAAPVGSTRTTASS